MPAERHRAILIGRCINEQTLEQIAEELGMSVDTIKRDNGVLLKSLGVRTIAGACFCFGRVMGPEK